MHPEVIVAGHICLDIIPTIENAAGGNGELLLPGKLIETGKAMLSTGGVVSNTGIALHRLGLPVRPIGKVGDDFFGKAILEILKKENPLLAEDMIVSSDVDSSYSIVLSAPKMDRIFLHHPGANDGFSSDDIPDVRLSGAKWFHFGYPPLMRQLFVDDGKELRNMFLKVKEMKLAASLDMAMPDVNGDSGQIDWRALLINVLPFVDLFIPSFEEIFFMLKPELYSQMKSTHSVLQPTPDLVRNLAGTLLDMGCKMVCIKLGDHGLYLKTSGQDALKRIDLRPFFDIEAWADRELWAPCFETKVVGTTGAGDCTVAGFLAGILKGQLPQDVLTSAVAVGACNVEKPDATSGILHWDEVQNRVSAGWKRLSPRVSDWTKCYRS